MNALVAILVVLFLALVVLRVARLITMPWRMARQIRDVSSAVQRRRTDKAQGLPVPPIDLVLAAGAAIAIVGAIVAKTVNGLGGLALMAIGIALLLLGRRRAKGTPSSTDSLGLDSPPTWAAAPPGRPPRPGWQADPSPPTAPLEAPPSWPAPPLPEPPTHWAAEPRGRPDTSRPPPPAQP